MHKPTMGFAMLAAALALAFAAGPAAAATGKIVCWKDKSGKTIGCGDKVPPEYQGSATSEMDAQGVTRRQTESVEQANARRQREQENAKTKAEEDRKRLDQQRQDTALLETFSNEKEIDLKRDRDIGVIDGQLEQLNAAMKPVNARYNDSKARYDQAAAKSKGAAVTGPVNDDFQRVSAEKARLEKNIAAKQAEKEELRKRYADYKKRYADLKSGAVPYTPVSSTTAAKK